MKRAFTECLVLVLWAALAPLASGQNDAAALAARQEAEERQKRLAAEVEDLKERLVQQEKRLAALSEEIDRLRGEMVRQGEKYVGPEELQKLADKIREVDGKRQADNAQVLKVLEKLSKAPTPRASEPAHSSGRAETTPPKSRTEKGYPYTVQEKDTLSEIIKAYRDKGVKVTQKQVMEANPKLNPDRLRPGTEIWIPDPDQK